MKNHHVHPWIAVESKTPEQEHGQLKRNGEELLPPLYFGITHANVSRPELKFAVVIEEKDEQLRQIQWIRFYLWKEWIQLWNATAPIHQISKKQRAADKEK